MNRLVGVWVGALFIFMAGLSASRADVTADLSDLDLGPYSYWDGEDGSGEFASQAVRFNNEFTDWGGGFTTWAGFSYSQVNDTNTIGYGNQYAVISGTGVGGTGIYSIVYDDGSWGSADVITLPLPCGVRGFYVNNSTYAALDMEYGSGFSRKFGGETGTDPDWFLLTIIGRDEFGAVTGTGEVYLADFRFAENTNDYILKQWTWVDLSSLGSTVKTLEFALSSNDNGEYGMNTPAYFALDNLVTDESYAPAAGQMGSTAVHMGSNAFVRWATGWTNYMVGANCDTNWQIPSRAIGMATGSSFDIVCLGEGGGITLTYDSPIQDGPGNDLAIFENGFSDTYLELAFVEVSSDGTNFARFFNRSLTQTPVGPFEALSATNLLGLGKYRQGYGEPFDLATLAGAPYLNVNDVRFVRVMDVSGNGSCTDSVGHVIYDPYLITGSAGFDLDAVGILSNDTEEVSIEALSDVSWEIGTSNAVFAVHRKSWDLSSPLAVHVAITGSASNGLDYALIPGVIEIPAGHATTNITVAAVWDTLTEGNESLSVALNANSNYILGYDTQVDITLVDASPADTWRATSMQAPLDSLPLVGFDYWNGSDLSGGFYVDGVHFNNEFTDWGGGFTSWAGFSYSQVNDTNTVGSGNQYAVISGTGVGGNGIYAVAYDDGEWGSSDVITLPVPCGVRGFYVNNSTYTALDMEQGSGFSKKFGGVSGMDPDWFLLTVIGRDAFGAVTGTGTVYLADFRFAENSNDYILKQWTWLDLSTLGSTVKTLEFTLSSSDNGGFGMNTPAYFAIDGLVFDPASPAAADDADWNDDGIPNLLAYASGWRMGETVTQELMLPSFTNGPSSRLFQIEFHRRQDMLDASLQAVVRTNMTLGSWQSGPGVIEEQVVSVTNGIETVWARSLITNGPSYMRLRAMRP